MNNINDFENIIPFDSTEYSEEFSKIAAFSSMPINFKTKLTEMAMDYNIEKYERANQKANKKFNQYAPATIPTIPNSRTKEFKNIDKLIKNLEVVFTPFGVIITTKQGFKKLAIQTIKNSEMNEQMLEAYKTHNENFFKKYISAMMMYESQNIKNELALGAIKNSLDFQDTLTKGASEIIDEYDDEIPFFNLLFYGEKYAQLSNESFDKLAQISTINDSIRILNPTEDKDAFLKLCIELGIIPEVFTEENYKEASETITPQSVEKNAKVVILPDRVVLTFGDKILTTIFAKDMNASQKEALEQGNKDFFKKLFMREAMLYGQRKTYYGFPQKLQKTAAEQKSLFDVSSIFTLDFIHPYIYMVVLNKKIGQSWIDFDEFVIIKTIEEKFKVPVIGSSALNKILSISAINSKQTDLAFTSVHAFEKIARSFLDLPIDFGTRETDSLDAKSITYALECLAICSTDKESVYSKLSNEVLSYIVDLLVADNMYAFYPSPSELVQKESEEYLEFLSKINTALLDSMIKRDTDTLTNQELEEETARNDEIIQSATIGSLDFLRSGRAQSPEDINDYVVDFCNQSGVEPRFVEISRTQVERNFAIDVYMQNKIKTLKTYLSIFKIG